MFPDPRRTPLAFVASDALYTPRMAAIDVHDAFRSDTVHAALHALRYERSLAGSPLLQTRFLEQALRERGIVDSLDARAWLLQDLLTELVEGALAVGWERDVGSGPRQAATDAGDALERLAGDFASGDLDRQAWSAVWYRYLVSDRTPLAAVYKQLGIVDKTFHRRLDRGYKLVAAALRGREVEALAAEARTASVTRVAEPAVEPAGAEAAARSRSVLLRILRSSSPAALDLGAPRIERTLLDQIARYPASTVDDYLLARVAAWMRSPYALDARFVALALLLDAGEDRFFERWSDDGRRFGDLPSALAAAKADVAVILGSPGAGKTTLLRRHELECAWSGLRGHVGSLPFLAPLAAWRGAPGHGPPPAPGDWLASLWARRFPQMPDLERLMAAEHVVFLLDGLNEIAHEDATDYRDRLQAWKRWAHETTDGTGHSVLFTCRTLDYSAPLSTPERRVPQVRIEPLDDDGVHALLRRYAPNIGEQLWAGLRESPHLEVLRSPFFLRLYIAQAAADSAADAPTHAPSGPASLFTGFVRQAIRREVELDNPRFRPGPLVSDRDVARIAAGGRYQDPYELPADGLFGPLGRLAHDMQAASGGSDGGHLRVGVAQAVAMLDGDDGHLVLRAAEDLGLLDEDRAADEVLFRHQLLQEFFAARHLALYPDHQRLRRPWRVDEARPGLKEVVDGIAPGEPLPPLPTTGWEATAVLATILSEDPAAFAVGLAEHNLVLAAQAAVEDEVAGRLDPSVVDQIRNAVAARMRDPRADLRERLAAGAALGRLGDPRLSAVTKGTTSCLVPIMVDVPEDEYIVGDDEAYAYLGQSIQHHQPAHRVAVAAFAIGQTPVTNAEWQRFVESGAYDDPAWWQGPDAAAWRRGEGTAEGQRANARFWRGHFQTHPGYLDRVRAEGRIAQERYEEWQSLLALDDSAFEAHLRAIHPDGPVRHPRYWREPALAGPNQPVVGICWYEARAYCAWLSAMTGRAFRLPSEVEWEVAARGPAGHRYAYGDDYRPLDGGNTLDTHIRRTSPVGVFPEGDSPFGVVDMAGNVATWTASLWGDNDDVPHFAYPYDGGDGREDPLAPPSVRRIVRGGTWNGYETFARAAFRFNDHPANAHYNLGLRLVCEP